jgi:hypothetical protein
MSELFATIMTNRQDSGSELKPTIDKIAASSPMLPRNPTGKVLKRALHQ